MNVLVAIAVTTGILSGIWGWVALSLGLISWAGFWAARHISPVRRAG